MDHNLTKVKILASLILSALTKYFGDRSQDYSQKVLHVPLKYCELLLLPPYFVIMTTLQAIGFTLAGGSAVACLSTTLFGYAVSKRSVHIAPRATARPRNVIFNPKPTDPCQNRGGPTFGWIRWVLSMTYDTMLKGVPGTGTRHGGLSGALLKVNLDGIILLRYHALLRRITLVAAFLFIVILLPIYYTSQCWQFNTQAEYDQCFPNATNVTALTNYERTTIANVPPADAQTISTSGGILWRLYMTVVCFWVIVIYVLRALGNEWVQVLAMRRVYYLEHDMYNERMQEIKIKEEYAAKEDKRKRRQSEDYYEYIRDEHSDEGADDDELEDCKYVNTREPWIPHPEQPETVPNISLYSVLVGKLPALPDEAADSYDAEAAQDYTKRDSIDWQLSLTATFFDHCVPNQPGFSSSVAAVTVLPSSSEMTQAWRKWYGAASKLRRLRFIQKQIAERRKKRANVSFDDTEEDGDYWERGLFEYGAGNVGGDDTFYDSIDFGPEQAAVFRREFAQSAAPCCPNGWREERLMRMDLEDLIMEERAAAAEVFKTNRELREIRRSVTKAKSDEKLHQSSKPAFGKNKVKDDLSLETKLFQKARATNPPGSFVASITSTDAPESPLSCAHDLHSKEKMASFYASSDAMQDEGSAQCKEKCGRQESSSDDLKHDGSASDDKDDSSRSLSSRRVLFANHRDEGWDRGSQGAPDRRSSNEVDSSWLQVTSIASNVKKKGGRAASKVVEIANGQWRVPSTKEVTRHVKDGIINVKTWIEGKSYQAVDNVARDSTWAVVTFTSRQAAVAARNCLADGRGAERWVTMKLIPTPPLADAAAFDLKAFRNCCRPVTISINDQQKLGRTYMYVHFLCCTSS